MFCDIRRFFENFWKDIWVTSRDISEKASQPKEDSSALFDSWLTKSTAENHVNDIWEKESFPFALLEKWPDLFLSSSTGNLTFYRIFLPNSLG